MFKVGEKVRIIKKGCSNMYGGNDCCEKYVNKIGTITEINGRLYTIKFDFTCNYCSGFKEGSFEHLIKEIKVFGIVNFTKRYYK